MVPLGYQSLSDAAAFPYVIMLAGIISLILTPVMNAYSRQLETNADKIAIEMTDNPEAFISAMTRLTEQNLSVAHPKRWIEVFFYDHPPYFRRIITAQEYIQSNNKEEGD
jgi:STE24 endopeptidase